MGDLVYVEIAEPGREVDQGGEIPSASSGGVPEMGGRSVGPCGSRGVAHWLVSWNCH